MPSLELPASSHCFCLVSPSFPLHLQFLCPFPFLQAINLHRLCPSSLNPSLLSPTLTIFLPYWCFSAHWGPSNIPALTVGADSFPSLRGVTQSHQKKLFFYLFCLLTQLYQVIPWECHKLLGFRGAWVHSAMTANWDFTSSALTDLSFLSFCCFLKGSLWFC